jgi:hypothetical protein
MTIFQNLEQAVKRGFRWLEFEAEMGMHLVERVFTRDDGLLVRAVALARAEPSDASG